MADTVLALALCAGALIALRRKVDVYGLLVTGAAEGLRLCARLFPSLVILLTAVAMLRGSGLLEWLSALLAPVLRWVGIPPETVLLLLIRPLSGSAALAVGSELILRYGADSLIGRTAAVMLGSTETTLYVLSVYFGACGIKDARYAPAAALIADAVGFWTAAFTVRLFFA